MMMDHHASHTGPLLLQGPIQNNIRTAYLLDSTWTVRERASDFSAESIEQRSMGRQVLLQYRYLLSNLI